MVAILTMGAPVTLSHQRSNNYCAKNGLKSSFIIQTSPFKSSVTVRASDPQKDAAFTSQADLGYLWKLGAGSVIGAAAIKYGSVLFPAITKPNIIEALFIISLPCLVAVFLLLTQSSVKK